MDYFFFKSKKKRTNYLPGTEFVAAVEEAASLGAQVVFGDRNPNGIFFFFSVKRNISPYQHFLNLLQSLL